MAVQKKKRRFNFIDVILLVVILAVAVSLVYVFISPYVNQIVNKANGTKISYVIVVEGVSDEVKYDIKKGDKVTETDTLTEIGKVVKVEYSNTEYIGVDSEGKTVKSDYPGKTDIKITIEATATSAKGTYDIENFTIAAGKKIGLRVPGYIGEGNCISVKEVKGGE